jgi:hypothetical protein
MALTTSGKTLKKGQVQLEILIEPLSASLEARAEIVQAWQAIAARHSLSDSLIGMLIVIRTP